MKFFILALLLASCAHKPVDSIDTEVDSIKYQLMVKHINELRQDVHRLDYYIDHERCFTVYSICLGERKKVQKECWATHEACVIRVYKQYKGK